MSVNQLVTVTEAARLVGRSRQSLYRDYIKTGKLSPSQDLVTNRKLVSISELIRVFGDLKLTFVRQVIRITILARFCWR